MPDKSRHQYWFFDFDGTLCDTEADIKAAWRAAICDLGLECPQFDSVYRTGPSINDITRELFPSHCDIDGLIKRIRAAFARVYDSSGFPATVPYPGIEKWLERLKASGAKVYIATNKRLKALELLLRKFGWDRLLDGWYASDMDPSNVRKKTDFLRDALLELGARPENCVMVGDTIDDISAGKANNMRTIGVLWGYGKREDIAKADVLLTNPPGNDILSAVFPSGAGSNRLPDR